jgi:hypothetical protein
MLTTDFLSDAECRRIDWRKARVMSSQHFQILYQEQPSDHHTQYGQYAKPTIQEMSAAVVGALGPSVSNLTTLEHL